MSSDSALATQYQRKTDKQHILDNPDTYIGAVETVESPMYVFDSPETEGGAEGIIQKNITYVPGLYKLFDEGIVNCRDHVIRMLQSTAENKKLVTGIHVYVNPDGLISMENDGNGIDVAKHPEYNVWIPEMIFAQLRTSTNYNKDEERIVGGKNGFGVKLVFIWSEYATIETVDHIRGLKYCQTFHRNLDQITPPEVSKCKGKPYTKITFKPDYARFGMPGGLSADMMALFKKRVYDIAAVSEKKLKVSFNGQPVGIKNFQTYIDLYIGDKTEAKRIYEEANERWEYAVALSETHEFQQVSFVNGICTFKGGKHVDYVLGQIVRKLTDYIEKKKKVRVNPNSIKEQLILFVRCDIVNPAFDSQTKDFMNTPSTKFGSSCTVSDAFIEKVAKMGVMDLACSLTEAKEKKTAARMTDGAKTKSIRGIANLIDANNSGGPQSKDCVLILCEGLSAMSGIVSGLSAADRNTIGIYPLKGKLLNVRGETAATIAKNKEITDIKKVLGLENGREYKTIEDVHKYLRYGKVMIMTDQDPDGSHIKGLCINLFHSEWASLIKIPGFVSFMNTPILRARKGAQTKLFYNEGEYRAWKQEIGHVAANTWTIKYFKGLGTSGRDEFREYFANKKIVDFVYDGADSDRSIDKVFNKSRESAKLRKDWLMNVYDKDVFLDTNKPAVKYQEFIDREMIHFSTYDCARSLPNVVDGLKISLRKILYCAFKRRLTKEMKVAQFAASVAENSAYHHGEASLNGAIVAMAQNFVGSNNINLLQPNGQFGTRLHGGDDSASERYIFTQLSEITRALFPEQDDSILTYLEDDGTPVEPEYYYPIIPMALVNGVEGIGTGYSCNIPPFNPTTIVSYLKKKLLAEPTNDIEFVPYYNGFKGTVAKMASEKDAGKYLIKGTYVKTGTDKIKITELPVGTWTMPYIQVLEEMMDGTVNEKTGKKTAAQIKDFVSVSTESVVDIDITLNKGDLAKLEEDVDANGINGVEKLLKLTTTVSTANMHMFSPAIKIHKYETVAEIIDEYFAVRYGAYEKRKAYLLEILRAKLVKLSNRAKYIVETLEGKVDLRRKKAQQVTELLQARGYVEIDGSYTYLTKMPMDSVTEENVAAALKEKAETEAELAELEATTCAQLWMRELDVFMAKYANMTQKQTQTQTPATELKPKLKIAVRKTK